MDGAETSLPLNLQLDSTDDRRTTVRYCIAINLEQPFYVPLIRRIVAVAQGRIQHCSR